jgi:hypothetical protein
MSSPTQDAPRWFQAAEQPRVAYGLLAFVAIAYSFVAHLLDRAHALPMPDPWLPIPVSAYFFWGTFFYAPVIVIAWSVATSLMHALIEALGGHADAARLYRASAFATGVGTLATLVPDLVTSPLRACGVIDERTWERSIAQHGGWFVFTWITLFAYLTLFLVTYPLAVRSASRLAWPKAIPVGASGFIVFQLIEYIFIR